MNKFEKLGMIAINYVGGAYTILLGTPMLPEHLKPIWLAFNAYLWIVSPLLILKAKSIEDKKEKQK